MRTCTLCGTTDPKRFPQDTKENHSSYCMKCRETHRKSGGKSTQQKRNAQLRKDLK